MSITKSTELMALLLLLVTVTVIASEGPTLRLMVNGSASVFSPKNTSGSVAHPAVLHDLDSRIRVRKARGKWYVFEFSTGTT